MNMIRRALIERWLVRHGWKVIDTVYSHSDYDGVWDIENAVGLTREHLGQKRAKRT